MSDSRVCVEVQLHLSPRATRELLAAMDGTWPAATVLTDIVEAWATPTLPLDEEPAPATDLPLGALRVV